MRDIVHGTHFKYLSRSTPSQDSSQRQSIYHGRVGLTEIYETQLKMFRRRGLE